MAHLASCPDCRAAFEEAKRYEAALEGVFRETVSKSRSPKSRVLRKIEAQGPRGRRGKSLANWFMFIVLMAALCFLIVVAYISYEKVKQDNIRKTLAATAELKLILEALGRYRADHGAFPDGSAGAMVRALQSSREGQDAPYFKFPPERLMDGMLADPWGSPYLYISSGDTILLYSAGPNRIDENGLGDDVRP